MKIFVLLIMDYSSVSTTTAYWSERFTHVIFLVFLAVMSSVVT